MGSELFKLQSLEDIASIHDSDRKPVTKSDRTEGEYPYYGASGITDYIDDYIFDGKYVLLSEDGDNLRTRNTPIAFIARGKFWVNNHAHILKGKNGNDTDFICYALQVADVKSYISGSTRPKITQRDMKKIPIYCPEIPEQKRIAHILGSLDDKIELNRQMNETLESMAQALFKSWFVDFDPVIDNALAAGNPIPDVFAERAALRIPSPPAPLPKGEGLGEGEHAYAQLDKNSDEKEKSHKSGGLCFDSAQQPSFHSPQNSHQSLFPSEFEFTEEMGWIPKGWLVTCLTNLINVKHGYAFKGEYFSQDKTSDVLLTPGNFKIGGGFKSDKFKYYNGPIQEGYVLEKDDLLITMTDLSKAGDTLGYPMFVPESKSIKYHHNQRLGRVEISNQVVGKQFLYRCLCSPAYRDEILANVTGSTVKHTSPTKIMNHKICHSNGVIEKLFEEFAIELTEKCHKNDANSIDLSKLRDTLLPNLLSGELRIPDAEKLIKEAGV